MSPEPGRASTIAAIVSDERQVEISAVAAIQASAHSIRYPLACAATVTSAHLVQEGAVVWRNEPTGPSAATAANSAGFRPISTGLSSGPIQPMVMNEAISDPAGKIGVIPGAYRMVFENEGDDVCVQRRLTRCAGSALYRGHAMEGCQESSIAFAPRPEIPVEDLARP